MTVEPWQIIIGRYRADSRFAVTVRGRVQMGDRMGEVRTMEHAEGFETWEDAAEHAKEFLESVEKVPALIGQPPPVVPRATIQMI